VPSVEDRVREIIIDQLGFEASEVKLNTSFVDDLGADFPWTSWKLRWGWNRRSRWKSRMGTRWITFRGMQSRFSSDSGLG
jgi:hypothetical protein